MSERRLRAEVTGCAQRLHARGWAAGHDGDLSVRLGHGRFLCTPGATSKSNLRPDQLLIVDERGVRIAGAGKPASQIGLHLKVFAERPDVNAVIQCHPTTATGFAVAGIGLPQPFLVEAVPLLGAGIPMVPLSPSGPDATRALAPFLAEYNAVLLQNQGVLAWGSDVEEALIRMELCEHVGRIAFIAQQLGGLQPLPSSVLNPLLEARREASVSRGDATRAPAAKRTVVACAPPPPGANVEIYRPKRPNTTVRPSVELSTLIRQEIATALKSK